ncbi:hypothetical protein MKEN_01503900 [Mycena kentingensis (nom. inval.)]|nr:hypothetical protein MKEN_01503900 [Mycena kentingensis (nom. inval.)]
MPELREAIAHAKLIQYGLDAAQKHNRSLVVRQILFDATGKEEKRVHGAKAKLVQDLPAKPVIWRGANAAQTRLYPHELGNKPISSLVLRGVSGYNRGVVLDFTELFLQIQWLTHSSPQWYTLDMWTNGICEVAKDVRGFRVGLAFVFDELVLALVTNDQVFQPTWSRVQYIPPTAIHDNLELYLTDLADWISTEFFARDTTLWDKLISDVIRDNQINFQGVGVYTADELAFLAGFSPFLTAREVFMCPSRVARLVVALHRFTMLSFRNLDKLLRPALFEGVLAPTERMRENYYTQWVHVSRKDTLQLSERMSDALDLYKDCDADEALDVYEPSYVAESIRETGLGHLVFGPVASEALVGERLPRNDALTMLFEREGLLGSATNLHAFSKLDLTASELRAVRRHSTYAYEGVHKKIWSLLPHTSDDAILLVGDARIAELFKTRIYTTAEVCEGPMEYRGHGTRVAVGPSTRLSVCKGDPRIPEYYHTRLVQGHVRHKGAGKRLDLTKGLAHKENKKPSAAQKTILLCAQRRYPG